jgi:Holliday junction resolvase RusA-like endonuclease
VSGEEFHVGFALPPSVNNLYPTRGGRRVKSEEYKQWIHDSGMHILSKKRTFKKKGYKMPEPPYKFELRLFFPDNRRRDASNYIKAVEDLVANMLGYDDKEHVELYVAKRVNTSYPRCEVILSQSQVGLTTERNLDRLGLG